MAATRARTAPRNGAAVAPRTPGFEPLNIDPTQVDPRFTQREPFFYLGKREFTIPLAFPASVMLRYNHLAVTQGSAAAEYYALTAALGEADFAALMESETLTVEHMQWIVTEILGRLYPRGAGPKAAS